jgi:hypothetical protein
MRSLNRAGSARARVRAIWRPFLAAALLAAALAGYPVTAASAAAAAPAATSATAAPIAGGCSYEPVDGTFEWVCQDTTTIPGQPGAGGGGGGGGKSDCTLTPLSQAQASFLGLQWPPPKGDTWEAITCPGNQAFGGVVLVGGAAAAAPAVTPQQLLQIAIGELHVPVPQPQTAPPRGKDGLVGLPEWFWVANWRPVHVTVAVGDVWARATATPEQLTLNPGGGLSDLTCRGPGSVYNAKLPLSAQHTDCSYTYGQPSAGQPGNAYQASVTVSWNISWVGSGGAGGQVAAGVTSNAPFTLRVAAGEALVTSG